METDNIASTHLGKKSLGSEVYDPSLLVAIPREENRKQYGILEGWRYGCIDVWQLNNSDIGEIAQKQQADTDLSPDSHIALSPKNSHTSIPLYLHTSKITSSTLRPSGLPFAGFDIWHAYEFSCMTENGVPVTRLMKMKYPCNNEFLVESKSLKLYLNSFNMMKFGKNIDECLNICKKMIEKDLSEKLQTTVEINFLDNNAEQVKIFENFENIMNFVDEKKLQITDFKENPKILQVEQTPDEKEYRLKFDSLRSNCRVTHQPDFGDAFIYYKSKKHIKEDSLVKYLTSFRSEYHFHEECCEMIFKRLSDILDEDDDLMVCALYTRRGGIDICPVRWKLEGWIYGGLEVWQLSEELRSGGQEGRLVNDSGLSEISQQQQTDTDLSPYRPKALSPEISHTSIPLYLQPSNNDIMNLLNTQILARNGIKQ